MSVVADRAASPAVAGPAPRQGKHLVEIQALRAVAVAAVVIFHLWPTRLPGGFVGVDVFFVISGFLITGHIIREIDRTGRLSLPTFWARRIRRLLPMALLVLLVTLIGVLAFLPLTTWRNDFQQIIASATYWENWKLAFDAVDYFAEGNAASPVQHYWSLSVEEQFYIVWPLLVVLAAALWKPRGRGVRILVASAAGLVLVVSFLYSIRIAVTNQQFGYFSTFSHAWEFAAGGLLACFAPALDRLQEYTSHRRWVDGLMSAVSWGGLGLIVASAFVLTGSDPFPGWRALFPVAGCLAVIVAGMPGVSWAPSQLYAYGPVQRIGDWSYSIYLWHWPPIVIIPAMRGADMGWRTKLVVLVATIVLAALSKKLVEDRVRFGALARHRPRTSFVVGLGASGLVTLLCLGGIAFIDHQFDRAQRLADQDLGGECFGASAATHAGQCPDSHVLDTALGPDFASQDYPFKVVAADPTGLTQVTYTKCPKVEGEVRECRYQKDDSSRPVVALVGDSHAVQLGPAILPLVHEGLIDLRIYALNDCRPLDPDQPIGHEAVNTKCETWREQVVPYVANDPDIDVVVTSSRSMRYNEKKNALYDRREEVAAGFKGMWDTWAAAGKEVLVVSDSAQIRNADGTVPDCIAASRTTVDPCARPRSYSGSDDPVEMAVASGLGTDVGFFSLKNLTCDEKTCHFVVGGLITNSDSNHLTATFSRTLAPLLDPEILARIDSR